MYPDRRRGRPPQRYGPIAVVLLLLLFVPFFALHKLSQHLGGLLVVAYVVLISALTYFAYWRDKRQAERGDQRTPEKILHLLEFLGGWPAAFLAQRLVRHKIAKRNYQIAFCAIIIIHEYVAVDALLQWHLSLGVFYRYVQAVHEVVPRAPVK